MNLATLLPTRKHTAKINPPVEEFADIFGYEPQAGARKISTGEADKIRTVFGMQVLTIKALEQPSDEPYVRRRHHHLEEVLRLHRMIELMTEVYPHNSSRLRDFKLPASLVQAPPHSATGT